MHSSQIEEWQETEIGPKEQRFLFMLTASTLQPSLLSLPYSASKWQAQIVLPENNFDNVTEPNRSPIGWRIYCKGMKCNMNKCKDLQLCLKNQQLNFRLRDVQLPDSIFQRDVGNISQP